MDAGVGGQLQGISLDSFLQMVQMEKTTCTLKVVSGKKKGTLFVLDGDLISAATENLQNLEAACTIVSWDDAIIEIENTCAKSENEIKRPLMHVLMEGLKLKDEKASEEEGDDKEATVPSARPSEEAPGVEETPAGRDISKDVEEFELHVAPKKKAGIPKIPVIAGMVILIAAAAYFTLFSTPSKSLDQVYQDTIAQVELTDDIGKQVALLQRFIDSAEEENESTKAAYFKIAEIKEIKENEAYRNLSSRADVLVQSGEYFKAVDLYNQHLGNFPDGPNTAGIKTETANLLTLSEKTDYEAVTAATKSGDVNRIDAYRTYIKNHPRGKQVESINKLIKEMEDEYFVFTEKQIAKSAILEDWKNCTNLVSQYTEIYPDGSNAKTLKKLVPLFGKNTLEYADYEKIMARAHSAGTNYSQAQKVLSDYLKSFPNTHLAKKIGAQIDRYKKMAEEAKINARTAKIELLLLQTKGRFAANGDGTFTDKRTGLMWCMLDSRSVLDGCLDYESAAAYIKDLKTGGHGDWRLPTPAELAALYKEKPWFPETNSSWLWTSKILKKYTGAWILDVTVVTANTTPSSKEMVKDSRYCGNVRAVRRPRKIQ